MVKCIGLDGFRRGWVAVTLDGSIRTIDFPADINWLAGQGATRVAIDIPIGLTDDGARHCETLARARLRPHGSRVFSGARRWLWQDFDDPDAANREALARGQTRISRQLWHIGPKIMEVDAFVRRHRLLDIRETHPELVFRRLNHDQPVATKHSDAGLAHRRDLLLAAGITEIDAWLDQARRGTGAKRDDVLDACAAALAARDAAHCLPSGEAPRDSHGLPMQIWY